ncbi:LacI family DNA-binding transcriptional regulator [Paenibacillus sp. LHD-117]|uniref:LacI family DNA-binding transcriptional regulator n=1 Tax=Paenibacillus sp. LHD-117 TaxID=3071412 RepID=UPI0027E1B72E|nr:LacI family DNA-binding transcriptional regulator [Paenibacillus sp. LHD-117]MDQ6421013.1 LacI family DNA-binding transcriptional regulator [Paenibacillus sp. LHD-117]
MKRQTIKDVAKAAGVSAAAVSYAINGKEHKVSAETLEKIKDAMSELNYVPNYSARSLVNNRSNLIGIVIPQTEDMNHPLLENPFYSEIISGIEAELRNRGYHFILSGVNKGKSYLDTSMQRNLDGAIIMGIYHESFYEELKEINIPMVLIDSYIHDSYFRNIGIDDEEGGFMATRYLIGKGHSNIALATGMIKKDGVVEKRFLGYKRALKEAKLFYRPEFVYEGTMSYEYGVEAGRLIGEKHPEITAVFATSDMMALGVITGLSECGKRVPEDVSVIGFDDIAISKIFIPKLTTIKQNITRKGIKAAECLLDAMNGEDAELPKEIILPLEIVERNSVRDISE